MLSMLSAPPGSNSANPSIPLDSLDPMVARLGQVVGLLVENDGQYEVISSWFENPVAAIQAIPTSSTQTEQLLELLEELLGTVTGDALGIPNQPGGRTWYPIDNPTDPSGEGTGSAVGLYMVTEQRIVDGTTQTVFGLGAMHSFVEKGVAITPYIFFPLLLMPSVNGDTFVLGKPGFPIELGVQVSKAVGSFGTHEVSFDGIKVAATIHFSDDPFALDVLLLNLKLPGRQPADTSVGALLDIPAAEWVSVAAYLLISQISQTEDKKLQNVADSLLSLLGLIGDVPSVDWNALVQAPEEADRIFADWLRSISSDAATFKTWLNDWFCLFHGKSPSDGTIHITGSGTRAVPFAIPLLTAKDDGVGIDFTFAAVIAGETRDLLVYPGIRVTPKAFNPLGDESAVEVRLEASAELMELSLPATKKTAPAPIPFPSFRAMVVLSNPTAAFVNSGNNEDAAAVISIGSIDAGFEYRRPVSTSAKAASGDLGIYPTFRATEVNTPYGAWDSIDFTNFEELVETAGQVMAALVQSQLDAFFSAAGESIPAKMSKSMAAVLGVTAPPDQTVAAWPKLLLAGPGGIGALITDPATTLGSYYTRCVTTDIGGKPAWQILLPQIAVVLGDVDAQRRSATGAGTAGDPWQIEMFTDDPKTPALYLQSWKVAGEGSEQQPVIALALAFKVPLPITAIQMGFSLKADLLRMSLPDSSGNGTSTVTWLPGARSEFQVTGPEGTPLKTPDLGGIVISGRSLSVAAGWNRTPPPAESQFPSSQFYNHVDLNEIHVSTNGTLIDNLGDIRFSFDSTFWNDTDLGKLTSGVFDLAGVWLLSHGGSFGVALTTAFGLLPDLSIVFNDRPEGGYPFRLPENFTLPSPWPRLPVENKDGGGFFVNPWAAMRTQLNAILSDSSRAIPMMQLLGWSIDETLPIAPDPLPTGTIADPWWVELTHFRELRPLFWTAADHDRLGFGVERVMLSQSSEILGIEVNVLARLDVAEINVASGARADIEAINLPRFTLTATARNPVSGQPLISFNGLEVGSVEFGCYTDRDGIAPIVTLYDSRIDEQGTLQDYNLSVALNGSQQEQILETLLYAVMNKLSTGVGLIDVLKPLMNVLADLALVLEPEQNSGEGYGINLGSWRSMIADPVGFLTGRMHLVLQDAELLSRFYKDLAQVLGFSSFGPPPALVGLPDFLVALGLMEQQPGGYAIVLSAWMDLILNPVDFVTRQGKALLDPVNPTLRQALVTALSQLPTPSVPLPDVPLSITANTLITLRIPQDQLIQVGEFLTIDAWITVNLQALTITSVVVLSSKQARVDFRFQNILDIGVARSDADALKAIGSEWEFSLCGRKTHGVPSPFEPIVFYPLPDSGAVSGYLKQLGVQVPVLLASSLGSTLLNDFVIGGGEEALYPVVYRILRDLGLTTASASSPLEQVQSLAGIFLHPVDWILSEPVLGNGLGGFSLDKVGTLLNDLPGPDGVQGPGSIRLDPAENNHGMIVRGLPFGSSIAFSAATASGIVIGMQSAFKLEGDGLQTIRIESDSIAPQFDLSAALAFGKGSGVRVSGAVTTTFIFDPDPAGPTTLSIESRFDDQFFLNTWGFLDGKRFPPAADSAVRLVPFGGLSQFQAGAVAVLDYTANQLIKLYDGYAKEHPESRLIVTVGNIMDVLSFFGVTSVSTLYSTFQEVAADPVNWMIDYFKQPKLPNTLAQLNRLMSPDALDLPGFSCEPGSSLLVYAPPDFPAKLGSLLVILGEQHGVFGVWVKPRVERDWAVLSAEAGIGFQAPLRVGAPLEFSLQVGTGIAKEQLPPQMPGAPILAFGLSVGTASDLRFYLRSYPLGEGRNTSNVVIALLPSPYLAYGDAPDVPVEATDWLLTFTTYFLVPILADIVLQTDEVGGWLNKPLLTPPPESPSPGPILANWGLLTQKGEVPDAVFSLHDLQTIFSRPDGTQMSPAEIIEKLFFVALDALKGLRIVQIGKDGGIYIASQIVADNTDYGMRVQIPDIQVIGSPANENKSEGSLRLTVQLGQWLGTDKGSGTNWIKVSDPSAPVSDPGVLAFFVRNPNTGAANPQFHPRLQLASLGVDIARDNGLALVNVNGFVMGAIQPRLYLALDVVDINATSVGGAIEVSGIGIPLGKDTVSGISGNTNPVAENLLSSGDSEKSGSEAETGETTDSVNPTFSVSTGYVYNPKSTTTLYVKLCNDLATECSGNFIWIPIQRAFGPIQCRQIGLGWLSKDDLLLVGFDGTVSMAGLSLTLINLKVGIPVTTPLSYQDYTLDLEGINLSFKGGPVEISGGFLKTTTTYEGQEVIVYSGVGMIKAATWSLTAIGSYALLGQNTPSLFVFAMLSVPIGGPPYFFVKGIAAGFGYNRDLKSPRRANDIFEFPFVKGVVDPTYFSGNNAEAALQKLSDVSAPTRGAYWLAAGLKFSSFEMINSFALLTVSFGTEFELNLLGLSTIELPVSVKGGQSYSPIARAELALLVSFRPSEGLLAVEAALSSNSYVLDKECRLTGGFAFYVWFPPSIYSGQFVTTLGGYHPLWKRPDHFPDEPRVGFRWLMPQYNVTIEGGAYFALVPTAVMAGGYLNLQYSSGNLKAWFSAQADMLISWKPFYYDIMISVSVGASYKVNFLFVSKTFSIELGASLNLWGPPTGGKVRVTWWIISFTVGFGPGKETKSPLDWDAFDKSFLPQPTDRSNLLVALAASGQAPFQRDPRVSVSVPKGLVNSIADETTGEVLRWIINPQSFELETASQVAVTAASMDGRPVDTVLIPIPGTNPVRMQRVPIGQATRDLGIVPMAKKGLQNKQTVTISKSLAGDADNPNSRFAAMDASDSADLFDIVGLTANVPKAMWNPDAVKPLDSETTIPNVIVGIRIRPKPFKYDSTLPVPAEKLQFAAPGVSRFSWGDVTPPTEPQYNNMPNRTPNEVITMEMDSLQNAAVLQRRQQLLEDLRRAGLPINLKVDTSLLAQTADQVFLAAPVLVPLGGLVFIA